MPGKVFINYRRGDEAGYAQALYLRLEDEFDLFMDVEGHIKPGDDFVEVLNRQVAAADVLLVVIGSRWSELLAKRQGETDDFVAIEIKAGLDQGKRIIPVLVGGAAMPRGETLPEAIRPLARRNAVALRPERFKADCQGLVAALKESLAAAEQERKQEWSARTEAEREAAKIDWKELTIAAAFLVVGVVAHILITPPTPDRVPSDKDVVVPLTKEQERRAQPKETFQECSYCPEMVVVPAGSFMMGSPPSEEGRDDAEGPQRRVEIGRFAVGKFEVTFDEWDACFKDASCTSNPNPRDNNWGRGRRPVINVSWEDITREYLPWLTRKTGKTYRLLTEAEWEYAARAGTTTRYAFGDTISESQAQYGASKTAAVGSFAANKFGLHDLHGNVWEWVEDNWHWKYEEMKCEAKYGRCWPAPPPPVDGSVWSGGVLSTRVARGGSWNNNARVLRSAFRSGVSSHRNSYFGFRVARTLD